MSGRPLSERVRCPDCWNGRPIPCAVGCREMDECCDKRLDVPCERCDGTGFLPSSGEEK